MSDAFTIRRATPDDAELISLYRRRMFTDMGEHTEDAVLAMEKVYLPWVRERLTDGRYIALLTSAGKISVAMAAMLIMDNPPNPINLAGKQGYILDVYTQPNYRRRGLATQLMNGLLDIAREMRFSRVALHPSEDGLALYKRLNFDQTNEMHCLIDMVSDP